jgi:hypothetical protein
LPLKFAVTGIDCPASSVNDVAERLEIPPPAYPPPPHPLIASESMTPSARNTSLPRDVPLQTVFSEFNAVCNAPNSLFRLEQELCGITMGNLASIDCLHWGSTSESLNADSAVHFFLRVKPSLTAFN